MIGAATRLALLTAGIAFSVCAELPPDLPGSELKHEDLTAAIPHDSVKATVEQAGAGSTPPWLDKAQKTWDAPPIAEQMAAVESFVPMGKGGIFTPRLTAATSEPEVTIIDSAGRIVTSGNSGSTFSVEPGTYTVKFGSGTQNQRISHRITVEEGKTTPLLPDWSALTIETADSLGVPFRGEYELVRLDEFETYGLGFGANQELGEVVKTWIVKPGIYKILGLGQGYNSITNFVTVRLLPGELCKLLLVQNPTDLHILGGGTIDMMQPQKITKYWKYGASIGGSVNFNSDFERIKRDTTVNTQFGLLATLWLNYRNQPFEWQTRIRLNEGLNFSGLRFGNLTTNVDDYLLNSLFIWRLLSWFGPYANTQIRTTFLPRSLTREAGKSFFSHINPDSTIASFDSAKTFRLIPSFSPILIDFGAGLNADAINSSFLEAKVRAGFGGSYSHFSQQWVVLDTSAVKNRNTPADSTKFATSIPIISEAPTSIFEFGPQTSISGVLRLGSVITADGELNIIAPVAPKQRLLRPDVDLLATISWRLSHWITIDYTYTYLLKQPENLTARIDESKHAVWLRFSYSSR